MENRNDPDKLMVAASQNIKEREFWLNHLAGVAEKSKFNYDYEKTAAENPMEPANFTFSLSPSQVSRLKVLSKGIDHTLHMILTAALSVLLEKYNGTDDIIVGIPIYKQELEIDFINTVLVLRNRTRENMTFKELLLQVRKNIIEANRNQNYPLEILLEQLDIQQANEDGSIFDVVILLENIHDKKFIRHIAPNMIYSFLRTGHRIEGTIQYNSLLYHETTIQRIVSHFSHLLNVVLFNLDVKLIDAEILSQEEKNQLWFHMNTLKGQFPLEKTTSELFEEQVQKSTDRIALVLENNYFTYKALDRQANRWANLLIQKDVQPDSIVGIMTGPTIEMVIGILAILKAGGAYLPVDPGYPGERINYILQDASTSILLTTAAFSLYTKYAGELILLDKKLNESTAGNESNKNLSIGQPASNSDLAYVMYTSGSTGKPKGVMIENRGVVRLVKNTNYIDFYEKDRILQTGPLVFDASTFEIWGALLNGLQLHLADKDIILTPTKIKKTIRAHDISTMWMTASLFNRMTDTDIEIFRTLRNLLVGGEVLSAIHIKKVQQQFPHLKLINGYGPTENTTFSTTYLIEREYKRSIPIGKPIANSTAYILDKRGRPVPIGVYGELVVGGDGVARGYLNNPELTVEKFDHDLWDLQDYRDKRKKVPGKKIYRSYRSYTSYIYRTGDLARWLPDGNIEFLGRIDQQTKIRGYRIELGEIETQLRKYDQLEEAVVLAKKSPNEEKSLWAYIVSRGKLTVSQLREYLSKSLPDYMIPAHFVQLNHIPLVTNGKIDRKALELSGTYLNTGVEYVEPGNDMEKIMAETWKNVLNIEKVGIHDNFFEVGGNSLKMIKLKNEIEQVLGVDVSIAVLFEHPTIHSLSQFLTPTGKNEIIPGDQMNRSGEINEAKARKKRRIQMREEKNRERKNRE